MCVTDARVRVFVCSFVAEPTMMIFYNQQELCSYHSVRERVIECFVFGVIFFIKEESVSNSKKGKMCSLSKKRNKVLIDLSKINIPIENDIFYPPSPNLQKDRKSVV